MDNFNWKVPYSQTSAYYAPRYEVIRVNGEASARNFKMAPNSTVLLLDETAPLVWFAQTDGAGYLTVTPYDITPHQTHPPVDVDNLAQRVAQLEEIINAKSNISATKQSRKQNRQSESIPDTAD